MRDDEMLVHPKNRGEWRRWLEENHDRSAGVWLVFYKKASGKRMLAYEDAIQEALRFGWIDSVVRPMDEERYKHRFSPRKKGSTWSESNKARVKRLMDEGLMTPAGTAKIEEAKADGSWDLLRRLEGEGLPADLAAALEANPQAKKNFETYTPSARKMYLWWLADAKRPETRVGRIAKVVEMAMNGEDLVGYMRKK